MKKGVSFADQFEAFACFIDHVCWFSDALYLYLCRGGPLAAGQTGKYRSFYRYLIGQQISDVEVKLSTCWPLCWESFDDVVSWSLIDYTQSGALVPWCPLSYNLG